jgi:hypothetical protein
MTKDSKPHLNINELIKQISEADRKNAQDREKIDQIKWVASENKTVVANRISDKEKTDDIGILEKRMSDFEIEFKSKSDALLEWNTRTNRLLIWVILVTIIAIVSFFLVLIGYWAEIYFHYRQQEESLWEIKADYQKMIQEMKVAGQKK